MQLTFGPVPSRRLGRSLGINHIPPKICSYSCVYCQLGHTLKMQVERQIFYTSQKIFQSVQERVERTRLNGEQIDYLAFVPDGEPTLDLHLGNTIELLKPLGIPIAVITNGSLMADAGVRTELTLADWVSLKVDAVTESVWHAIDRPHRKLNLPEILDGMRTFSAAYRGRLLTETMLIEGVNDSPQETAAISRFIAEINPETAYLSIPTRPPAEPDIFAASPKSANQAFQIFSEHIKQVELLTGYEGNQFSSGNDVKSDILSITSVHPMRRDALEKLISDKSANKHLLEQLVKSGALVENEYGGHKYYIRNFAHQ